MPHTGDVRHGFDAAGANGLHQVHRLGASASPGAVRDGDEARKQWRQVVERVEEVLQSFLRLRREELEGEAGVRRVETVSDFHVRPGRYRRSSLRP